MSSPADTRQSGKSSPASTGYFRKRKVCVLVAGETFHTHNAFMKMLKSKSKSKSIRNLKRKEVHTQESCNVILLFCPVVSRIGTDMEAAMARVTEDKPVILVFMHHCHHPSHMTNITVQQSRGNIVQVVHCAFLETKGLLPCKENQQAVEAVHLELKKYKKKKMKKIPQESVE